MANCSNSDLRKVKQGSEFPQSVVQNFFYVVNKVLCARSEGKIN